MANTLSWTLLPNGIDRSTGRARLSLMAHPALDTGSGTLAGTPLENWPALANGIGDLVVQVRENGQVVAAERLGTANAGAWVAMFPPTTKVGEGPGDDGPFSDLAGQFDYAAAHFDVQQAYAEALETSPTELLRADHPVSRRLVDVARAASSDEDDVRRRSGALADAARFLLPQRSPRVRARTVTGAVPVGPAPLSAVPTVEQADIHAVLSLLGDHPHLLRHLGLVLDLTVPVAEALRGERTIRVATATGGAPLQGAFAVVNRMWSRTRLDRDTGVFTMVTRPGPGTEVVDGMLDMAPTSTKYLVGTIDVASAAQAFAAVGARAAGTGSSQATGLPPRRDIGFTIVQTGRLDGVVRHTLEAKARLSDVATKLDGQPVLFADDVTAGYRIDVSKDRGPFRSLMRRVVAYHIGPGISRNPLVAHDEGVVAPVVPVQQEIAPGEFRLSVGEDVASWAGWGLAAPMPGRAVLAETRDGQTVTDVESKPAPGYALTTVVRPEPNSLERLRYGSVYTFRSRTVTLAGDSLSVEEADREPTVGRVSKTTLYPRTAPVLPPVVVARHPLAAGETLLRVVVTSDGDGTLLSKVSERHLAPPPGSVELAERHGLLDAAFGPDATAVDRAAMLAVAKREAGSFTDLTVPGPNGTPVPAAGISVAGPDGPGVPLPVPPGQALPAGQYVVHDTDALRVPYLADFGAAGAALVPIPSEPGASSVAPYGGRWPDVLPARLRLAATTTESIGVTVGTVGGRSVLDVAVPPAVEVDFDLSSPIRGEVLEVMGDLKPTTKALAKEGQVVLLSPRRRVTFLHATRRPIGTITRTGAFTEVTHPTRVVYGMKVLCHGPSTARVDLVATWTEIVDPGFGPVTEVERRAVLGSQDVPKGMLTTPMDFRQDFDFGDTRRRDLQLELVGTTRHRDCFPELADGDPLTQRRVPIPSLSRLNTARPCAPDVAMVVPIYRWTRTHPSPGVRVSTRERAGVRIWLRRPWMTTGPGEQLGVIAWGPNQAELGTEFDDKLMSRWGVDLLEESSGRIGAPLLDADFGGGGSVLPVSVPGVSAQAFPRNRLVPYEVRFDAERGEWFADVDVKLPDPLPAFLRLALVRFQPQSTAGNGMSKVVATDWVPLQAPRSVTLKSLSTSTVDVEVTVTGRHTEDRSFVAEVLPRPRPASIPQPPSFVPTDVMVEKDKVGTTLLVQILPDKTFKATGRLTLPAGIDALRKAELLKGRLVVREMREGYQVETDKKRSRVEWVEVMDVKTVQD